MVLQFLIHSIEVCISIWTFWIYWLVWLFLLRDQKLLLLILTSSILRFGSSTDHLDMTSNRWIFLILLCFLEYGFKRLYILCLSIIIKWPHIIEVAKVLHMVTCTYRSLRFLIISRSCRPLNPIICLLLIEIEAINGKSLWSAFQTIIIIVTSFIIISKQANFIYLLLFLRNLRLLLLHHHEHRRVNRIWIKSTIGSWIEHEWHRKLWLLAILRHGRWIEIWLSTRNHELLLALWWLILNILFLLALFWIGVRVVVRHVFLERFI